MIKFIVTRYLFYIIIFFEILISPRYFNPKEYGEYEYYKYIIGFASFALLGSHTGYIYYKFSKSIDLFQSLLSIGLYVLIFTGFILSIWINHIFLMLPFVIMGLSAIIEKKLQVSKNNILAILFKPLNSFFLLFLMVLNIFYLNSKLSIIHLISISSFFTIFVWIFFILKFAYKNKFNLEYLFIKPDKFIYNYYLLIKAGFLESLATIILGLFLFVDRYYFKNYYPSALPTYSLAFNFSQFVFIGLNSIAFVKNIEISERINKIRSSELKNILFEIVFYLFLFLLGVLFVTYFYSILINNFKNIIIYSLVLSLFLGIFYTFNIFGSILLLKDKQHVLTFVLFIALILNIILTFILNFYKLEPIFYLLKTGIIITLTGLYIYLYAYALLKKSYENLI
jgi:hypothetical protein